MQYGVDDRIFEYSAEGENAFGSSITLLDHAIDLTKGMPWHGEGFTIERLLPENEFIPFIKETNDLLNHLWTSTGLKIPRGFSLDKYHTLVASQDEHIKAVNATKLLTADLFPLGLIHLEERMSELLTQELIVCNPYDDQRVFDFRVIRPLSGDNNPLHRDVWLEDYKDCINLYIPIAGSNALSSLIIAPQSHRWSESKIERTKAGAIINGQKFNVPAVTDISVEFEFIRPDPKIGEVLVFSPYLIHGGSVNLNDDTTRVSIEVRLWRK
jgi:hypothetical protein